MSHPGPSAVEIHLTEAERAQLIGMSVESSRSAIRAKIVLACAEPRATNAQPGIRGSTCTSSPPGSSWINQVERWFGFLTDQLIRRGVHKSVQTLENDIRE